MSQQRTSLFPQPPALPAEIERRHGGLQRGRHGRGTSIDRVLAVDIPDAEVELIVVESNSTDATREIVSRYAADPRVRLVLQDAPRGKGAAVREGFEHATGGIILIQDADLEYSVDDYPKLIAPIMAGRSTSRSGPARAGAARPRDGRGARRRARHQRRALGVHLVVQRHLRHEAARPVHDVQGLPERMHRGRRVRRRPLRLRLGARREARPPWIQADRDPGRVQRAFLRRRQEGPLLPRSAHVGRGMPPVPLLLPPRRRVGSAGSPEPEAARPGRTTPQRSPCGAGPAMRWTADVAGVARAGSAAFLGKPSPP